MVEEEKDISKEKQIEEDKDKDKAKIKDAKQEYLRKEVIDKGYNPEEFSNFVSGTKGFSTEEIGFEAFKHLVEQFKNEELKKASEVVKDSIQEADEEILFDPKIYKPYTMTIRTVKQEATPLESKEKVSVQINDPQKVEGGLFSSMYFTYQVSCEAINSKTRRIHEDFDWLRLKLSSTYPNVFIPPLLEKSFFAATDLSTAHLRLRYLSRFVNVIIRKKLLRTSPIVYSFLTLTPEEFEAFKKKNKVNGGVYKSIEEYPTAKGQIDLNLTKDILINAEKIQKFIQPNIFLFEKLNEALDLLLVDFAQTSIHMKEVASIFNNLSNVSMKTCRGDIKSKAFSMFKDLTNQWAIAYVKQKDLFDYQLKEHFDYMKREYNQFNDLINDYNVKLKAFEYNEVKLQGKKESLFNSKKYSKWEIIPQQGEVIDYPSLEKNKEAAMERILTKETEASMKNKHHMTYSTMKMVKEYHRLMKYQDERIARLINNLEKNHTVFLGDANNIINLIKMKL